MNMLMPSAAITPLRTRPHCSQGEPRQNGGNCQLRVIGEYSPLSAAVVSVDVDRLTSR